MRFEQDGLHLQPVVPEPLRGKRMLSNIRYRNAILTITIDGYGSHIQSIILDGQPASSVIPTTLIGRHAIDISRGPPALASPVPHTLAPSTCAPATPIVTRSHSMLRWAPVQGAAAYRVYCNGVQINQLTVNESPAGATTYSEFQVSAVDVRGIESFLSAPVITGAQTASYPIRQDRAYVDIDQSGVTGLLVSFEITTAARYLLAFCYSNGSGAVTSDNCCAIRTLFVDEKRIGPIVMPQRGKDQWDNYGTSSRQIVYLAAGIHTIELRLEPTDLNMNGEQNHARVATVFLTPLSGIEQ